MRASFQAALAGKPAQMSPPRAAVPLDLVFMVTAEGRASSQAASLFGQALSEVMKLDGAADSTPVGLACDLVSLSSFEGSPRAQFVALVTSLEALVGDPPDSPAAVTGLI